MEIDQFKLKVLEKKDLEQFYTKPPTITLTSHENYELLESNFINEIHNNIFKDIIRFKSNEIIKPNETTDTQGIIWDSLKLKQEILNLRKFKNKSFTNIIGSKKLGKKAINIRLSNEAKDWNFNRFIRTSPKMSHFQLINQTLCCDSSNNIYFIDSFNLIKRVSIEGKVSLVLKLDEKITVMESYKEFLLIGTLAGWFYIKNLQTNELTKRLISYNIINSINCYNDEISISTNDGNLIKLKDFSKETAINFPWAINSISNYNKLKLISGDNLNSFIIDNRIHESKPIIILKGHYDYSFSCDWSKDGIQLVTSNQDSTVRLYDIRNYNKSKYCFGEENNAVRSVKFSLNDKYLNFNENIDSINLINLENLEKGIKSKQVFKIFGKLTNSIFMNYDDYENQLLTIGVCDNSIGGIVQYKLENDNGCIDFDYW